MDPAKDNARIVAQLYRMAAIVQAIPLRAAEVYVGKAFRGRPIVERHFTPGNQERYGWDPLNARYAAAKAATQGARNAAARKLGRTVARGASSVMLVRTGALRSAVTGQGHQISQSGDVALVTFENLPAYAIYLHEGTPKMPKRSPVEPSESDAAEIKAELEKYLSAQFGTGGGVPVSGSSVPNKARIA